MKHYLVQALAAGAGGFLGAIARFSLSLGARKLWPDFPLGTMAVNLLGCLILGVVMGASDESRLLSPTFRSFLTVGLLGSFTTFATFSYEGFSLMREGRGLPALIYVVGSVVLGLLVLICGHELATRLVQRG